MRSGRPLHKWAWLVAAVLVAGCSANPTPGSTAPGTPGMGPEPEGKGEEGGIAGLRDRLRVLSTRQDRRSAAGLQDPAACEDLCGLATEICGVTEQLCDLAQEHPGDEAYQGLCREARLECREAQESCVNCVQSHQRSVDKP